MLKVLGLGLGLQKLIATLILYSKT